MIKTVKYTDLGLSPTAVVAVDAVPSWLHVTPVSGSGNGVLQISADENTALSDRSYQVRVYSVDSPSVEAFISVRQEAASPYLWLNVKGTSTYQLQVAGNGGTYNVPVLSNDSWSVLG